MRLHRLTLQAFGPFPGRHEIDFDALAEAGLHLIHGPTGAGKTSILDAICFALFNDVPGQRKGMGSVACALASAETTPQVELVATLAGRRLRILRQPAYERAKRRGTGTTTEPMKVHLWEWLDDDWQVVSNRVDEIGRLIDAELGLSAAQFAQVVLLPQGDFSRFLHAGADERDGVLRTVFDIDRFVDLEGWFAAERDRVRTELARVTAPIELARSTFEQLVADADDLAGTAPNDADAGFDEQAEGSDTAAGGSAASDDSDQDPVGWATELAARMHARADAAESSQMAAREKQERASADLHEAQGVLERHQRAREAHQLADALAVDAEAARLRDQEARDAERAAAVLPALDHLDACRTVAAQARDRAAEARPHGIAPGEGPDQSVTQAGILRARLTAAHTHLAEAAEERSELTARARAAAASLGDAAAAAQTRSEATARLDAVAADRDGLTEQLSALETDAAALAPASDEVRAAQSACTQVQRAIDLSVPARTDQGDVDRALRSYEDARSAHDEVRRLRTDEVVAGLAQQLRPGQACGVCGSTEHPAPARPATGSVTEEDVLAAGRHESQRRDALALARETFARSQERLREAVAAAADLLPDVGGHPVDAERLERLLMQQKDQPGADASDVQHLQATVTARLARARENLREAETRERRREQLTAQLAQAQQEAARLHERRDSAASQEREHRDRGVGEHAEAGRALLRVRRLLQAHDDTCPCAQRDGDREAASHYLPGVAHDAVAEEESQNTEQAVADLVAAETEIHASLGQMVARHRELDQHVQRWAQATGELQAAEATVATAAARAAEVLADSAFSDADAARKAARSRARREELAEAHTNRAQRQAQVRAVLDAPDVRAALEVATPDLAALRTAAESAHHAAQDALKLADRTRWVADKMVAEARRWQAAQQAAAPVRVRADEVEHVSDLVRGAGSNQLRMRLSAYVLSAKLEIVVGLANVRLQTMTDGRFSLVHDDGPGRRGRRGGLGLNVVDAWTGQTRATATLSGGETFMASLALALALADAVQADAGGRAMETLFVDEGFGSLDEQSLEQVLTVLDDLRAGGRTVGIVSHVAELRDRIPAQIEVHKSDTGSRLQVRTPAVVG